MKNLIIIRSNNQYKLDHLKSYDNYSIKKPNEEIFKSLQNQNFKIKQILNPEEDSINQRGSTVELTKSANSFKKVDFIKKSLNSPSFISNYSQNPLNLIPKDSPKRQEIKKKSGFSNDNNFINNYNNEDNFNNISKEIEIRKIKELAIQKTRLLEKRKKSAYYIQKLWKGYLTRKWFKSNK